MKDCMYDPSRISQTHSPASFLAKNQQCPLRQVRGGSRHVGDRFGNVSGKHGLWSCHPTGPLGWKNTKFGHSKKIRTFFCSAALIWNWVAWLGWFCGTWCLCVFVDLQYSKAVQQHDLWCCSRHDFVCVSQASMCLCRRVQVFWPST